MVSKTSSSSKPKFCKVCNHKAHGVHFGALTCRACAAFFRRVAAEPITTAKCRKSGGVCNFLLGGLAWCKICRLKKCKEMGMTIKNFQFNRDRLGAMERITPSMAVFLGKPQFSIACSSEPSGSPSTFVDISDLLKKAIKMLETERRFPFAPGQNRLQKMDYALNMDILRRSDVAGFKVINSIGLTEAMTFWEHDVTFVSKWLSHFDEFQMLPIDVKTKLLKVMWFVWNRLEMMSRTALLLRSRGVTKWDRKLLVVVKDCFVNLDEMRLKTEWLTKYTVNEIGYYLEGVGDWSIFESIQPILDLNPTDVERNYMLAHLSFTYASKELNGEYTEILENFLKILADDLHNYYEKEREISRYSDRIVKMMKVNNSIMKVLRERKEKLTIARTFNIFSATFSEPEMFRNLF